MAAQNPHELPSRQLVTFRVGGERFAADIRSIREVVRTPEITLLPSAGREVVGVANVRGRILPVADAGICLNLDSVSKGSRMLVVDRDGETFGLLVDSVEGVAGIEADKLMPIPPSWSEQVRCVTCVARVDDRLIAIVDVGEMLAPELSPA